MYHKENNDASSLYPKAKMSGSYLQSNSSTSGGIFGLHTYILPHPSYTHLLCVFFLVFFFFVCVCMYKLIFMFHSMNFLGVGRRKDVLFVASKVNTSPLSESSV